MTAGSSPWCQRSRAGRHTWRHVREGGFDKTRYLVERLDELPAKAFCAAHHYAGASYPAALGRYGLTDRSDGRLVGVAVLGAPVSAAVLTAALPTLEPYVESQELARLVLLDEVPANAETWMLARVFRDLHRRGIQGVVSFADPLPRTAADGTLVKRGHVGWIYQGWCGLHRPRHRQNPRAPPRRLSPQRARRAEGAQPRAGPPLRRGPPGRARGQPSPPEPTAG